MDEARHPDDPARSDQTELTPPGAGDLRSDTTFGRTDRYGTMDPENASRARVVDEEGGLDTHRPDVQRGEHATDGENNG